MMMPEFEAAAKKMKGKVKFGKVNLDEESLLAMRFEIMAVPVLFLFKNGKLIKRNSGWLSGDGIEELAKESF